MLLSVFCCDDAAGSHGGTLSLENAIEGIGRARSCQVYSGLAEGSGDQKPIPSVL